MEYKIIEKKKDSLEVEFSDKSLAYALLPILTDNGVDAYTYCPHPLTTGYRLCVTSANADKEFKKAVDTLSKEWAGFKKAVAGKVPKK